MRGLTGLIFFIVFILLLSFRRGLGLYVDWLWFDKVGYTPFARPQTVGRTGWPSFPGFLSPLSFT